MTVDQESCVLPTLRASPPHGVLTVLRSFKASESLIEAPSCLFYPVKIPVR